MIIPAVRTVAGKKASFDRPTKNGFITAKMTAKPADDGGQQRTAVD